MLEENKENKKMQMNDAEKERKRIHKRNVAMIIMGIVFLTIGLIWFLYWLLWGQFHEYTDDAYVNGNMVQLMSQISGTVTTINTDDTQLVKEGQVLIKFDPADTEIALKRAQANLANTVRDVRQLFENLYRAKAQLSATEADLTKAKLDFERRTKLVGESAVSREEYQHYLTAKETAQARYNGALQNFRKALATVANTHIYTHPLVLRAKANFKQAYLNRERTIVYAPVTGFIAKRTVQVGQFVSVNRPMLAIVPLNEVWVDANYKESQLKYMRKGQPVALYADAFPQVSFHGKIDGLNVGTGAAFSLLPPQNATGNWIKIVQRLPVRVRLDPNELKKQPLLLGLSMHATTDISDFKRPMLAEVPLIKTFYQTDIFARTLAKADLIIAKILRENSPDMFMPGENSHG